MSFFSTDCILMLLMCKIQVLSAETCGTVIGWCHTANPIQDGFLRKQKGVLEEGLVPKCRPCVREFFFVSLTYLIATLRRTCRGNRCVKVFAFSPSSVRHPSSPTHCCCPPINTAVPSDRVTVERWPVLHTASGHTLIDILHSLPPQL